MAAILLLPGALAHEDAASVGEGIAQNGMNAVAVALAFMAVAVVIALGWKGKPDRAKPVLFLLIVIPVVLATAVLVGSTIYLNQVSATGGPVHWHADFEIWSCGQKIDLVDPTGLENRVGTAVVHEHGDDRIHVEGVLVDLEEASLHEFFEVVGGGLSAGELAVPLNAGSLAVRNGDLCPDGQAGELQLWAYRVANPRERGGWQYVQERADPDYVLSPHSAVPPGDCIILEFGPPRERTDRLCETYRLALERGELTPAAEGG